MTSTDVSFTGTLSNVGPRHDGGLSATLTHRGGQAPLIFPYEVSLEYASQITAGAKVTVRGALRVTTVEAANR